MTTMTSATVSARGPTTGKGASIAATSPAMDEPPMAAAVVPTSVMPTWTVARNTSGCARRAASACAPRRFSSSSCCSRVRQDGHDRDLRPGQRAIDEHQSDDHSNFSDDGRKPLPGAHNAGRSPGGQRTPDKAVAARGGGASASRKRAGHLTASLNGLLEPARATLERSRRKKRMKTSSPDHGEPNQDPAFESLSGSLTRRELLRVVPGLGLATLAPGVLTGCGSDEEPLGPENLFQHGVASGNPLPRRRDPLDAREPSGIHPGRRHLGDRDRRRAPANRRLRSYPDYRRARFHGENRHAKARSGTTYYYRFRALADVAHRSHAHGARRETARLRLGVASCSSFSYGYFHAYRALAERADLDAVIHLGDYIYESGPGQYGDRPRGRAAARGDLAADYRTRHAQYKRDPDLQEAHRQHPFICVWDDHEYANNAWDDGAVNHQPGEEGDWSARKKRGPAGLRRVDADPEQQDRGRIWRKLGWGDLADLILLDTRMWARQQQHGRPSSGPRRRATRPDPAGRGPGRLARGADRRLGRALEADRAAGDGGEPDPGPGSLAPTWSTSTSGTATRPRAAACSIFCARAGPATWWC